MIFNLILEYFYYEKNHYLFHKLDCFIYSAQLFVKLDCLIYSAQLFDKLVCFTCICLKCNCFTS